jgi:uncharacterized membrane protein YgdD (TMEM256/DUF423 family)
VTAMGRPLIVAGALLGCTGVAAGAFGAHALRGRLGDERAATFRTGADYQLWHAVATVAVAVVAARWHSGWAATGGWLFVAGTLTFSGSLYALAWTGSRRLGAVTPIGGVLLLAGWACVVVGALAPE